MSYLTFFTNHILILHFSINNLVVSNWSNYKSFKQMIFKVSQLEASVSTFNDENAQLKHSLQMKDDLLRGNEEESCSTGPSTPSISGRVYRGGYTVQETFSI